METMQTQTTPMMDNVVPMEAPKMEAAAPMEAPAMANFDSLDLPEVLRQALAHMQFTTPTPIQAAAIPLALAGKDILGSAQTGTGKTGAFGIPLIAKLINEPNGTALVMTPTRELAVQVLGLLENLLGANSGINTALLIGGEPMPKQFRQLKMRPRLIVGTPGRINDHLQRGTVKFNDTNFLVLDETDRMLDMGFGVQIDKIVKHLATPRQTLMFSATLPANIVQMSNKYLVSPERVSVGSLTAPIAKIKQEIIHLKEDDKFGQLLVQLQQREGSVILFVQTKWGCDKMAKKLTDANHSAEPIHGNLRQQQRDRVIQSFRDKKCRILVATDIAARGLDVPHIETVINYDMPQCPEDYIHRIGRTARAGAEGTAVNLISSKDGAKWKAICRLLNPGDKIEGSQFTAPRDYANASKKKRYGNNKQFRRGSGRPGQGGQQRKAA